MILPADLSWSEGAHPGEPARAPARAAPEGWLVDGAAAALRSGRPVGVLVGTTACGERELALGSGIAAATGARLLCETFPARLRRGAGVPPVSRLAYLGEMAAAQMEGLEHLVLVGARPPVSFFAYPGRPSRLTPPGCALHHIVGPGLPADRALSDLADAVGAAPWTPGPDAERPLLPSGPLTAAAVAAAVGALLPEGAIVCDESNTSGFGLGGATAGAPPHDWLTLTGGAIGQGLPLALGAAIAEPGRRVVALQSDGSALYTFQALWTMARESCDVVVVLYNNRAYAILEMELERTGAARGGTRAARMLDLSDPDLDFVAMATGMGVPARRAATAEEFADALAESLATPGPSLIEAVLVTRS